MSEALLAVPGLSIDYPLHESARTVVYRATRLEDGAALVVKCLRSEYPSTEEVARLRNEFEITRAIAGARVVRPEAFATQGHRAYTIAPYFEGEPLARLMGERLPLDRVLALADLLVDGMGDIHEAAVVHRDLSPSNILVDGALGRIGIIDFEIASRLPREQQAAVAPTALQGTLGYLSPEQTGRVNRAVDYRSDYYSMGAILYELLAGVPAFAGQDANQLVHAHIAKRPVFPIPVRQKVPPTIREIVLKLLAKAPEDRYQSVAGILWDLRRCLRELRESGTVELFALGSHDVSEKFAVAQGVYGREAEVEVLLRAFAEASRGQKTAVLLSGASGIGKSALVREIHRSVLEKRAYFIVGKADELKRNIPHATLSQAMADLVHQIQSEGDAEHKAWRAAFLGALGAGAATLSEVVPELESLTGPLAAAPAENVQQAQVQQKQAFLALLGVVVTAAHPVVLFLDDVQWVDEATLGLLRSLLLDASIGHLLFIGAHRADISPGHPFAMMIEEVRQAGLPVEPLALGPLPREATLALCRDTFPGNDLEIEALAELVHQRAEGSPFFVGEYLQHLYREGLIHFDRARGAWSWTLAVIREHGISDDLVELVRTKIRNTPAETRRALETAACIGERFDLATLAAATQQPPTDLVQALLFALREDIVTSSGASYHLADPATAGAVRFRFVHDQIRQAAYEMLDEEARRLVHLRLAQVIAGDPIESVSDDRLFDVVDHLNLAWSGVTSPALQRAGLELNLRATRRARLNTAYDVALRCVRHAMSHLPADAWRESPELASELHLERAQCEHLAGSREIAEAMIATALRHLRRPVERAPFYAVAVSLKTSQGLPADAFALGREALAELGIHLPRNPAPEEIRAEVASLRQQLAGWSREAILAQPRMVDPDKLAVLRLINSLGPPTYFTNPHLYALLHCIVVRLSLAHGHASESVRGYSVYGMILVSDDQHVVEGRQYGELAVELADNLGGGVAKGVSRVLLGCFIWHFSRNTEEGLPLLEEAYRKLREAGDIVLASFALAIHAVTLFFQGAPLAQVETSARACFDYTRTAGYRNMADFMACVGQVVACLRGVSAGPCRLDGPGFREAETVASMETWTIKTPIHWYYVAKMQLCLLFGEEETAARLVGPSEALLPLSLGAIYIVDHAFYAGLTAVAQADAPGADPAVARAQRRTAGEALDRLRGWSENAPGNFSAMCWLLEAECARLDGENERAFACYEHALEAAQDRQNLRLEALSAELAGKYHLAAGRRLIGGAYVKHAHYAYGRWGALAKTAQLERDHPAILGRRAAGGGFRPEGIANTTSLDFGDNIDVGAITKATHALSQEIELDRLITTFMHILVENAGAESACLIMVRPAGLRIVARLDGAGCATSLDEPVAEARNILPSVVERVARSEQLLLYEDAARAFDLAHDPNLGEHQPQSVLCFPVLHLGRLHSIVYLENNLATGMFTPRHVEVLRLLSAQAAISVENANLYTGLREKVAQLEEAHKLVGERERLKREMEIAEKIQVGILPRARQISSWDIAAVMDPADEVGGDYYDIIPVQGSLWIGVGDVTGHGLQSGLSMLMIQSGIAALVRSQPNAAPHELLRFVNEMLYENVHDRLGLSDYATLVLLRCEPNGRVWFAGAHEDIFVWRAATRTQETVPTLGTWVGAIRKLPASATTQHLDLAPGDVMLLSTDGILEARNDMRQCFGTARLQAAFVDSCDQPVEGIRDHLLRILGRFTSKTEDDVTLLVMRYLGPDQTSGPPPS